MARTTLNLDPSVLAELRIRSKQEGKSIGELASQLLARCWRDCAEPPHQKQFAWISRDLGKPAVDPEDKYALNALLEDKRHR